MMRAITVILLGIVMGLVTMGKANTAWANVVFLNRHAYPFPLVFNELGPFHENDLRTFDVATQWSNESDKAVQVTITFTFFDSDSGDAQVGEDGQDDPLMTTEETFTIPKQSSYWAKIFRLTVIGERLNQGFDHPNEGAALEVYVDAQIVSIHWKDEE